MLVDFNLAINIVELILIRLKNPNVKLISCDLSRTFMVPVTSEYRHLEQKYQNPTPI